MMEHFSIQSELVISRGNISNFIVKKIEFVFVKFSFGAKLWIIFVKHVYESKYKFNWTYERI